MERETGVHAPTVAEFAADLRAGATSAQRLATACLERIADPAGVGARTYVAVDRDKVLAQAQASDMLRRHGIVPSPLAGIPVSLKDLFDVAGEVTRAASKILADRPPAERDAPAIARLRAAGAVFIGRTNMTEFAYSGIGINPHHGTPSSPWDRATGRVPGGSSSGAAVSVADGMAMLAIGTDTGGSCRIPAALCGVVGFKPTASRISREGVFPLARSFDSIGPIGRSVACVALADAIMAGEDYEPPIAGSPARLRLAIPQTLVLDGLDETVARAFEAAVRTLRDQGAAIDEIALADLAELPTLIQHGGIAGAEILAVHRPLLKSHAAEYDPRVRARIELAAALSGADYVDLLARRTALIARFTKSAASYDALILPTVPIVAPPFSAFEQDDDYFRLNRTLLRNPGCFNMLDGCAITLPCHHVDEAPVGLMLASSHGRDRALFGIAATVEAALRPVRGQA
ncbi:MAG: amidase [Rhodomicrobiaceae bacterium]